MPSYRFRIVNVFTHAGEKLSGNPLCVFEDATGLEDAAMQALTRQFNLSESTFILPSTEATARVRIFCPEYEMPFAGHPTLGTAHVCRSLGLGGDDLRLQMKLGIIPVTAAADHWTLTAQTPTWREVEVSPATIASAFGLQDADIADRPLWIKAGNEQLMIPLTTDAAVRRANPRADAFSMLQNDEGLGMAYLFSAWGPGRALSRFFFPQGSLIIEDPATGSAAASLGGWWLATKQPLPCSLEISQGEYVGRPSTLFLNVNPRGEISVGGEVIQIGQGSITL